MNRRKFIKNLGISITTLSLIDIPVSNIIDYNNRIKPYEFDLDSNAFQNDLQQYSLPTTIKINSKRQLPSKTSWRVGEGQTSNSDSGFHLAVKRHNHRVDNYWEIRNVATPTFLLHTAHHDVYGQFLSNASNNFKYGIIKGFDKRYYIVHPAFRRLFTYKHSCYGLPMGDYTETTCSKCNEKYIKQYFKKSCTSKKVAFYYWHNCDKGGRCSGVPRIKNLQPCGIKDDGLQIGAEY